MDGRIFLLTNVRLVRRRTVRTIRHPMQYQRPYRPYHLISAKLAKMTIRRVRTMRTVYSRRSTPTCQSPYYPYHLISLLPRRHPYSPMLAKLAEIVIIANVLPSFLSSQCLPRRYPYSLANELAIFSRYLSPPMARHLFCGTFQCRRASPRSSRCSTVIYIIGIGYTVSIIRNDYQHNSLMSAS